MARSSPQTRQKLERERARRDKRERKQEKKAAAAAARAEQQATPENGHPFQTPDSDRGPEPDDERGSGLPEAAPPSTAPAV